MDKNAIKKFAVWARRELIARVSQRAAWYGITEKDTIDEKAQVIHGKVLTADEQAQRRALIAHIRREGYQQVMEEVAYTWFNRFIALRFMEVNGYLPSYTRVFSDDNGAFNPQILKDAIHLDIDGLDMEKVYAMEEANETEALFKYLVITQCNDLNRMLPGMFQKISDYTELLFPDFLLREGSVAHQMVTTIPEDDWKDAVQIIGWLYQYYNAEPKDEVFAALKKNIKISKEKIPAATQLFTPDWIVRYMVENSLGRLWVEGHPNDELKANWKYYLEEATQEPEVEAQLKTIRAEYAQIDPASILCCDPCMGSGHILVYMFDVLMQIYLSYGYTTNEAVESIVRNNLWGMDIDDRAAQLAYFAVMMKAQQYDHRWLAKQVRRPVQPNVFALQDSGDWSTFERQMQQAFTHHPSLMEEASIKTAKALFETFANAKEYGSIIQPEISLEELNMLEKTLDEMAQQADLMDFVAQADAIVLMETLRPLIRQCRGLVYKYHTVVTNPPYMGNNNMDAPLIQYAKDYYPDSKLDLFAMMIERCRDFVKDNCFFSLITMHSWMFLGSFDTLRESLLEKELINMLHLGSHTFNNDVGTIVQNAAFVYRNSDLSGHIVPFIRLVDYTTSEEKERNLRNSSLRFDKTGKSFLDIPGTPMAYWVSDRVLNVFKKSHPLSDYGDSRSGLQTSDNNRFLRLWFEVDYRKIGFNYNSAEDAQKSGLKWFPHTKGGTFRKWYGNIAFVVNWFNDGAEIKAFATDLYKSYSRIVKNTDYYFESGITWSHTATKNHFGVRYVPKGVIFNVEAPTLFRCNEWKYMLGLLNSGVAATILPIMNQTMHFLAGDTAKFPVIYDPNYVDEINALVQENIELSMEDWDSQETSWGFKHNCLVRTGSVKLSDCITNTINEINNRKEKILSNEKRLDEIYASIYGLTENDITEKTSEDITTCEGNEIYLIKSFISYAIGCVFGRYSLDRDGVQGTGPNIDLSSYKTFMPDIDGIIPICDDEYFDDDIVGKFIEFVRAVYGITYLEENLEYIARVLGGKGSARDVIRNYFLQSFFADHCDQYSFASSGKRPIYWLFDSGKKNGFKCLIYMHRYQPDTIARIRTDYLHETQARYRNAIETLERQSANASTSERVKMTKRLNALKAQAEEARIYEEKIHHLADQMIKIDLDDGVKVNYAKFADVLAPIK